MRSIELLHVLQGVLPSRYRDLRVLDSGWLRIRSDLEMPDGHHIDVYIETRGERFRILDGGSATVAFEAGEGGELSSGMRQNIAENANASGIHMDGLDLFVDVSETAALASAVERMARAIFEISRIGESAETPEAVASD